ncbi:histidine kinase dimerization/phosphoacceptor domain -containing protein [Roseobacter sp. CCS2]|uniref:histidine kinase dimerization/phosphoacceptor domain -containing protein n=1 Tax=Roseobacter sp. CCS2 TaxID=391593 RepID=UPI0000F3F14C|nr:histidine kinase dimerization/phosphoacceptor domain -containing protein [Roseobacter sp. CCS2]EBA11150.1 sensor histidine kinase, putative [Roseobacter sp. CCS2]
MIPTQWYKRLNVQLVVLLTLALLPLGSVAIFQTNRVAAEADRTAGLAFLGLTDRAARAEQVLIERAVGAARLLGSIAPDLLDAPDSCVPVLSRFVKGSPDYSFVGILPPSGIVACSSVEEIIDFSAYPNFETRMAQQEPTIVVNRSASVSGDSVFVISEPFNVDGEFGGFVSVSIPHTRLPETTQALEAQGLVELITFNNDGAILTTRSGFGEAEPELPSGLQLENLSLDEAQTFRTQNRRGVERRYSIVAIEGSPAAVMAIWNIEEGPLSSLSSDIAPALFPILMWFASMGVAMLAMHTLVLRHLSRIRTKMDHFADTRRVVEVDGDTVFTPLEIEDLERNFERMGQEIMRDEATLEGALREKGVLVKEIHHRVKNNLQLISSIMNMQIRSAKHDETRDILRRIQDRVLSLATIHRDLYQSQDAGRVNVGTLIAEIVEKSVELAIADGSKINVQSDIDPLSLYPDQAVPLSLLAAEAATNAMKYIGDARQDAAKIDVQLKQNGSSCIFVFSNTIGKATQQESTGLGAKLMNAFALQLGGQIDIDQTDDLYTMTLTFNALEFEPEARDY